LFAYGPADATESQNPHHLLSHLKSRLVLPSWYRLTQVVLEKRPLNGCSVVVLLSNITCLGSGGCECDVDDTSL